MIDTEIWFCYSLSKMLTKKNFLFILILMVFFGVVSSTQAYTCNQRCSANPSGCNSPLICHTDSPRRCRHPDCVNVTSCNCPSSWTKLKNTSFFSINDLFNPIPAAISPYDSDDNGLRYFIVSDAVYDPGLVLAKSIDLNNVDPSIKRWQTTLNKTNTMSPSNFLSYVKSRKEYKTLANINEITTNDYDKQILIIDGPITISDANKSVFNNKNLVLIINGDLTFSATTFTPTGNPSSGYIAFLTTGTITFANTTTEVHGIFIAPTINLGTAANQGIKIVGNLAALTSLTNNRKWASTSKPSVFIVFDQAYYINLFPYLSTATYQWNQTL